MKNILCMYSGGVDSMGMLYDLLINPKYAEYTIHAHHIHLINREDRAHAEKIAVAETIPILQKIRKFCYTENVVDFSFLNHITPNFPYDSDVYIFVAGQIANAIPGIEYIAIGRTKTDKEHLPQVLLHGRERAKELLTTQFMHREYAEPKIICPMNDMYKTEIWNMLPQELRKYAWYCRIPQRTGINTWKSCGNCVSCKEMQEVYQNTIAI